MQSWFVTKFAQDIFLAGFKFQNWWRVHRLDSTRYPLQLGKYQFLGQKTAPSTPNPWKSHISRKFCKISLICIFSWIFRCFLAKIAFVLFYIWLYRSFYFVRCCVFLRVCLFLFILNSCSFHRFLKILVLLLHELSKDTKKGLSKCTVFFFKNCPAKIIN